MTVLAENVIQTRLTADTANFTAGFQKASKSLDQFIAANRTVGDVVRNGAKALLGVSPAAALAAGGLTAVALAAISSARQASALASELLPVAQRLGTTTEELSKLKFAAEQSNTSFSSVQTGLRVIGRTAALAAAGSKQARETFRDLGVEFRNANGSLKTSTQLFREVADVVAKTEGPILKAGKATAAFGRQAGPELVPLLTQGTVGLDKFGKEAEELGIVISSKFARDVDEFSGNMNRLKAFSIGAGQALAQEFVPILNELLKLLIDVGKPALKAFVVSLQAITFAFGKVGQAGQVAGASARLFFAAIKGDRAAFQQAQADVTKYNAALNRTFDEWLALRNAESPAEPIADTGEAAGTAAQQLEALAEAFKDLDKEAIAPILEVAKELVGEDGIVGITKRFDALIARLEQLARTSAVARKALAEVIKIRNEAIAQELEAAQQLQGPATEQGEGPLSQREQERRAREEQIRDLTTPQGPETREGVGPERVSPDEQAQFIGEQLQGVLQGPETAGGEGPVDQIRAAAAEVQNLRFATNQFFEDAIKGTNGLNQAFLSFGTALSDQLVEGIAGAKLALGDLFRTLMKDLAKAIVRATVLTAIMSFLGGGGFSIAKLTKNIQAALGFGPLGFQDKESSILGRASQARNLPVSMQASGEVAAPVATSSPNNFRVVIEEPGPLTKARIYDDMVLPRARQRQRQLNEEPL